VYPDFCKEYREVENFKSLIKRNEFRELKDRIKILCDTYKIKQFYEAKPKLWQDFCDLLRDRRHFMVHPIFDSFKEIMSKLPNTPYRKYTNTATKLIKYYYIKLRQEPPKWLDKNQLFRFKELEYLNME